MKNSIFSLAIFALLIAACSSGNSRENEDLDAKRLLQGVWMNEEQGNPAFYVQGDSIFYPDSVSQPVAFWIYQDSLYIEGHLIMMGFQTITIGLLGDTIAANRKLLEDVAKEFEKR